MYKNRFLLVVPVVLMLFHAVPALAQEGYDGTHLFEEEGRRLAETHQKETISENQLRTTGIVQMADSRPARVGDEVAFNTVNVAMGNIERITAVLRRVGKWCYVYVQKGQSVSDSALDRTVKTFDERIHPISNAIFGKEWSPGVDGDPRITLLYLDIKDTYQRDGPNKAFCAGYFHPADEYTRDKNPSSNQREMLYLDLNPGNPDGAEYLSLVAHEFQHMIHWHYDPQEYSWVNESLSQVAVFINGFAHPQQMEIFKKYSDNNMCAWSPKTPLSNYGQVYLWAYYLISHIGKNDQERNRFVQAWVADTSKGMNGITKALKSAGLNVPAGKVFSRFCVANFLNNPNFDFRVYGYGDPLKNFRIAPFKRHGSLPASDKGTVKCWSAQAVSIDISKVRGPLRVAFQGAQVKCGKYLNDFDVAAILCDGRNGAQPVVEWLDMRTFRADQVLKAQAGNHNTLLLVACNTGIEIAGTEKEFAEKSGPAGFSYLVSAGGVSRTVATRSNSGNGRHRVNAMISTLASDRASAAAAAAAVSGNPIAPVQASVQEDIIESERRKLEGREDSIFSAIQTGIDQGDLEPLMAFLQKYETLPPDGRNYLLPLRKRILEVLKFQISQNGRKDLEPFLEPLGQ